MGEASPESEILLLKGKSMDVSMKQTYEGIKLFLDASVSLRIMSLQEQGGPTPKDFKRITTHSNLLGEHGDAFMFKSKKKGLTAQVANAVADSIAVLSFIPGGLDLFDRHWESKVEENE